jgi:hypothetical protein
VDTNKQQIERCNKGDKKRNQSLHSWEAICQILVRTSVVYKTTYSQDSLIRTLLIRSPRWTELDRWVQFERFQNGLVNPNPRSLGTLHSEVLKLTAFAAETVLRLLVECSSPANSYIRVTSRSFCVVLVVRTSTSANGTNAKSYRAVLLRQRMACEIQKAEGMDERAMSRSLLARV